MSYMLNYLETMPEVFADAMKGDTSRKLYNHKVNGQWVHYTYQDVHDKLELFGLGLLKLGVNKGDKVAILSDNRPEWCISDWTCAHFGFVSVPVYPTSIPKQILFILNHSEANTIIVNTKENAQKVLDLKKDIPSLKFIITMDKTDLKDECIHHYNEIYSLGDKEKEESGRTLEDVSKHITANDLWSIIYTSGTSGDPKGVMISQFNMATNVQQSQGAIGFKKDKRWLSFLPLSHSFERVTSLFSLWIGAEIYFAESIAKVAENLKEIHPQYMTTVPRLLEKVYAAILEKTAIGSPTKQKIFHWAQNVGSETVQKYLRYNKKPQGILAGQYALAKTLVYSKIADVFGGHFVQCVSGGAPMSNEIGEFFAAAGIRIIEGYGLTEMSPVTHVNDNNNIKFGTVGLALPDVQTKIAEDGEILLDGPNKMVGYYNNPEEEKEAIDKDGWFHTGDIGYIDEDGYLHITDRKKNLIVTAGGKNIAPSAVEREINHSKFIEQSLVIGDRRKFLTAILVPSLDTLKKWGKHQSPVISIESYNDIAKSQDVKELLKAELDEHQKELARYEQIKYFYIPPAEFTIEGGELTASLKVKRKYIIEKYKKEIDELYNI